MKYKFFVIGMLSFLTLSLQAQQKLVLYEEFTGENCPPCAIVNPPLWTLLSENSNKILLVKYQSPIPYQGPLFMQNKEDVRNRLQYYGIDVAPIGRMDGKPSPGNSSPNQLTKEHIADAAAIATPVNLTVNAQIVQGDSINISIHIDALKSYSGTDLKLRIAMLETLEYPTPPGTNGETIFHNVMRKMYPGPDGLAIANNWLIGQTQDLVIKGKIPNYVDQKKGLTIAAWIQDDANKKVIQAALFQQQPSSNIYPYKENFANLSLYPNPARNEIQLDIMAETSDLVSCYTTDISGKQQATTAVIITSPGRKKIRILLSQLSPGMYLMNMKIGEKTYQQKFIKE